MKNCLLMCRGIGMRPMRVRGKYERVEIERKDGESWRMWRMSWGFDRMRWGLRRRNENLGECARVYRKL